MNSLFIKIRDKHALWYKGIVFIVCILICTYLLPKNSFWQTRHLKAGDVWKNENLVSEIDFLIEKSNSEIQSEKKNLELNTILYFKKNNAVKALVLENINRVVDKKQQLLVTPVIDSLYNTGVYLSTEKFPATDSVIYLVSNNEVLLTNTTHLFDREKATAFVSKFISDKNLSGIILKELKPNVIYDEALSKELAFKTPENTSSIYKAKVDKGGVLLRKNDVITSDQINLISSYNKELQQHETYRSIIFIVIGQLLTCVLILGIMMLFLAYFRKTIFSQNTHVTFIFLLIVLIVFSSSLINIYRPNYIYAVPYCLVPIIIRVFFDSRTALFNFLNVILLCSFFTVDKFEFVFIQLIAGIGTIFSVADMGKRSKLLSSALLTLMFYVLAFAAYHLVNNTAYVLLDYTNYKPFIISSLCVLFSFPLIFLFEKLFDFTSNFTLLELCDLDSPLLRQLSQKIPGTFQHSLQVANLAEEACYKIGGNALLVRTGAMYHDIGKMEHPRFFTENQVGEVSPHADLSPEESAQIIIEHVIKGIEKAKEYQLPEAIIDFIRTHHGTTTTRYFLHNYKKEHEGEFINEDLFRYPGPIPFSKETAVLMMADGVEAASRSLKKYDAIAIDELVDRIINHQINENQFINADITFRDINQIKKIFKKRLMNIYHVRIEYPR